MPYYPLSQVQTGLFTNGGEYVFKYDLNIEYKGSYFKTSNGKFYTEKFPNDQSLEIVPINQTSGQPLENEQLPSGNQNIISIVNNFSTDDASVYDNKGNVIYIANTSNYASNAKPRSIPSFYYPILSQKQKEEGQLIRYFTKKTNELKYIEINKKTYDSLLNKSSTIAWDLYDPAFLIWKIKGDEQEVYILNQSSAVSVEQQYRWPGFSQYFKDKFTQFYLKPNTQENLYTSGGEFTTPNGKEYIGYYHIHPEKGPMVGATHMKRKHDLLTPINPSAPQIELSPQPSPSTLPPPPSMGGGGYSGGGGGY